MKIRLWKLGNAENKIYPTKEAIKKLSEMLMESSNSEIMDLIWGPDITVQEIEVKEDDINLLLAAESGGYKAKVVLEKE